MAAQPPPQFNAFQVPSGKTLTADEAKAALDEMTAALNSPDASGRLEEAKNLSDDDPLQLMTQVLPLAVDIAANTLLKFGFPADVTGVMQFMTAVREHSADPEIKQKVAEMSNKFLPPQLVAMASAMASGGMPPVAQGPQAGTQ